MYIYLVERTDDVDYDEYDSHVIIAESIEEAENKATFYTLPKSPLKIKCIGTANDDIPKGSICSSFNAG